VKKQGKNMKLEGVKSNFPAVLGLFACTLMLYWVFLKDRDEIAPIPKIMDRHEGCVHCHKEMEGFSQAHRAQAIGCASCHLGNPFSLDKKEAHQGMVLVPGNLAHARRTCGTAGCHPEISEKIRTSLMATGRGMVTVNRFVFGEAETPDGEGHLSRLGQEGAEDHLRHLCAACHLAQEKVKPGPINESSRGGGCVACHLHYSDKTREVLKAYEAVKDHLTDDEKEKLLKSHPALTIKITNAPCFGCHSRSGRISTSYEGWHDTLRSPEQIPQGDHFRMVEGDRLFVKKSEDFHHEKGLMCIDCHTWREAMGDGREYLHQEDQVEVGCEDCHFQGVPRTVTWKDLNELDRKILNLRGREDKERRFLISRKRGNPLLNVFLDEQGRPVMMGKNTAKIHPLKPPLSICTTAVKGHERLSCQSCHTAWAPHCISCHTAYDPMEEGYDHLKKKWERGAWVEYVERSLIHADPPALGVRGKVIDSFIPGMILTIDTNVKDDDVIFRRLYAPTAAHTTPKKGRDCESCHNDPLALGLGRGTLSYKRESDGYGRWFFTPAYVPHLSDHLPLDAWTGFLETRTGHTATRINARPFNEEEQKKILQVGACLTCHRSDGPTISPIYSDFEKALARVSDKCVLPRWE